ncbi:hypothetical protein, partial [Pseudomonas bubulae]|uniref:hypothetical protein n=1 Tax=Pseudomonas bubulae TaxID=2316085 RepID=UPI002B1E32A8
YIVDDKGNIIGIQAGGLSFGLDLAKVAQDASGNARGVSSPLGTFLPAFYGRNICIMGDSIAQQNTFVGSGSLNFLQHGSVMNALAYL